jgi:hypothetical protein
MGRRMAALVMAAAGMTAGCGAEDVKRTVDPVAQAADRTVAAGGAELEGAGEYRVPAGRIPITLSGAVDFEQRRARMALEVRPNKVLRAVERLRLLRTAGGARKAGSETVHGVQTTHYRATIDPRRFPETVSESERERARKTVEVLGRLDPTLLDPMPVDVWVDADGLIRRERGRTAARASTSPTRWPISSTKDESHAARQS